MIRLFNESDLQPLHRMIGETIDASYSPVYSPRAVCFFKEHHSMPKIKERSAVGETLILASEQDGAIQATGTLLASEIIGVFVHPGCQRRGHGRAIMTELERKARILGLPEVSLSISLPSRVFYEHLGYVVGKERSIDVGGGECLKYWSGRKVLCC